MTATAPTLTTHAGIEIPQVALGTWPMNDDEVKEVTLLAFELGYRHIDTAENYENERGVGAAVAESGLPRAEIFVTTKFNKAWHGDPAAGLAGNLERLGLDYVDLLLIHWPNPDQDRYVTAWEGMLALREQGLVRSIGTSNFKPAHLDRLIAETSVAPEVNQIELHPYLGRAEERAYHAAKGILTEAWSPLGRGNGILDEPVVRRIAAGHDASPGQVVLAWDVQQGMLTAPKSADRDRLRANLDVFGLGLSPAEIDEIGALRAPGMAPVDSDVFGH